MRRRGQLVWSLCLVSTLVEWAGVREAEARCVNVTTGIVVTGTPPAGQPNSNETVVCDTTAPNPTPASTVVSAAAGSTNVSVTVLAGSILSSTARAIGVVNNSIVLNQGRVSTSGLNAFGISTTGNGSTLTNQGAIVTTGSRGFGLDARGSNSTLINSGTINVSGPNAAGIRSTETTASTLITNSATITVTGSGASPDFAAGVLFQAGAAGTFVNQAGGTVVSATDSGVRGADANIIVRNAGTITGGNGIAINLGNGNDIIQVTDGQINGAIVTGTGSDQFTMSGGTVTGNVNLGGGNNTVTMTGGQINGSIALGAGNDTVQLFTGATITGSLDGGGGTNALTLDGTGTASLSNTISNFQTLTKQNTGTWDVTSSIAGATAVAVTGGTLILSGDSTYTGGTTIGAGTLQLGNGGTTGSIVGDVTNNGALAFNRSDTFTFPGVISGTGSVSQIGAGTTVLTANNTYTGATTVAAGTLIVNGSIGNSAVMVNSGATLGGIGTVGATIINSGGTFAPGNSPGTMTVAGNLTFQSGALYLVQVNPSIASLANVSGTATLAGSVQAAFAPGGYVTRAYTILSASGGRVGTFDGLSTTGVPAGFHTILSYTSNSAILNLVAALEAEPGAPGAPGTPGQAQDEVNIGHALDAAFNNGSALPPAFVSLFNLTGSNLTNALEQLSGEPATGAQKVAFQLTDQFLNLMLDPFVDGRSGVGGADHPALGFAPEREAMPPELALAYASVFKAPPAPVPVYEPRWTAWGGAYGGSNRTTGDLAVIGSHDLSARTVGVAGGLDYHLTPDTVVGIALAGGGTNWSLSQGLGGGKSDAFQAGLYGATRWGPAYLAAAFAFANHWMSTDRVAVGDHLTADFNAQSYGGRLEGGYRFGMPYGGITPYAAIQAQSFHTPGFTETDAIANGFGLAFGSRDATDTRSELGARFDRVLAVYSNAVLALRGRVAWAHDWVSDATLVPVFQALPGASFIVNGATPARNSALTSAGTELRLANGVTLLAKFDGEFASHSSTYAGTGTIRYRW
jgi:autotransporter-associated beta strand protein